MTSYLLDPNATLDFVFDWSGWLTTGEVLTTTTVTADPGLVTPASSPATAVTTTTVTVWLSGGTVGTSYAVVCRVTTSAGRIDDRTIRITSAQR